MGLIPIMKSRVECFQDVDRDILADPLAGAVYVATEADSICQEALLEESNGITPVYFKDLLLEESQLLELEKIAQNPALIAGLKDSSLWEIINRRFGGNDARSFFHLYAKSRDVHQKIDELFFLLNVADLAERSEKYLQWFFSGAFLLFPFASSPNGAGSRIDPLSSCKGGSLYLQPFGYYPGGLGSGLGMYLQPSWGNHKASGTGLGLGLGVPPHYGSQKTPGP